MLYSTSNTIKIKVNLLAKIDASELLVKLTPLPPPHVFPKGANFNRFNYGFKSTGSTIMRNVVVAAVVVAANSYVCCVIVLLQLLLLLLLLPHDEIVATIERDQLRQT
jgi:hypothetical protein